MLRDKQQGPHYRKENHSYSKFNHTHGSTPASEANCKESDFILPCKLNTFSFMALLILREHVWTIDTKAVARGSACLCWFPELGFSEEQGIWAPDACLHTKWFSL